MEHRNIEPVDQPLFDIETAWGGNVLEVDSAEPRRDASDGLDEFVRVLGCDFEIEHVDVGEMLE